MADKILLLTHAYCCKGQSKSNSQGEPFRDGNHDDSNGSDEDLEEFLSLLGAILSVVVESRQKFDE